MMPSTTNISNQGVSTYGLAHSDSSGSFELYAKPKPVKRKKPNIHMQEMSFFLKVLEAKVRFDPEISEG